MNATSQHAKVRTSLRFAEETFVSGGVVAGKMEVECKTDKGLALGIIMVELLAFEGAWSTINMSLCSPSLEKRTLVKRSFCCTDLST